MKSCKNCNVPLPADIPGGLCPACLLAEAMEPLETMPGETVEGEHCPAFGPDPLEGSSLGIGGRYKILQRIGEGGFGTVFMAEQSVPMRRRVAIKVLKAGMDTRQVLARFEAESQALAMMDHPNIARVFDSGETPEGRPYFVMELVRGIPITTFCDHEELDTKTRLGLFVQVCRAVQHAHQKGIIHRDLKPGNVLITVQHGAEPVPKVIDFGVAKAMETPLTDKTLFTRFEQMIGTPAYMSPEQAGAAAAIDIDTRTDIYALGVLLYELLTGTTPIKAETLQHAAFDEVRRILREEEAPRPSARLSSLAQDRLSTVAKQRHTESATLGRQVRGDLDWIVMCALEKDRRRRYETANALARDVERHLDDEPVTAGAPSVAYRTEKFIRRHRAGVAVSAVVLLSLVGGLALAGLGLTRARTEAVHARKAEKETAQALRTTDNALTDSRAATGLLNSDLGKQAEAALWFAYAAKHTSEPKRAELNKRRFLEWCRVVDLPIAVTKVETDQKPWSWDLKFAPGDELLRIMTFHGSPGEIHKEVRLLPIHDRMTFSPISQDVYRAADVHPREPRIALVDVDGVVSIYDWEAGRTVARGQLLGAAVSAVAYSRDGSRLALGGRPTGEEEGFAVTVLPADHLDANTVWESLKDFPRYLEWSPNDRFLLTGAGMELVNVFRCNRVSGKLASTLEQPLRHWASLSRSSTLSFLRRPFFSYDGQSFFLTENRYDLESGKYLGGYTGIYSNPIRGAVIAPSLESIERTEEFYATEGPRLLPLSRPDHGKSEERKSPDFVFSLAASPDGSRLLSVGGVTARMWNREEPPETIPRVIGFHSKTITEVAFSHQERQVATSQQFGLVRVWKPRFPQETPDFYFPTAWTCPEAPPQWADWSQRSNEKIIGHSQSSVWTSTETIVNRDATVFVPIQHNIPLNKMRATASWSLPDGAMLAQGFSNGHVILAGAFSPVDPARLVTAHGAKGGGELIQWNALTGEKIGARFPLPAAPRGVAYSPDGQQIAAVCCNGEVLVVDLRSAMSNARQIHEKIGFDPVYDTVHNGKVGYSPDGRFLFAWGTHGRLRCFDPKTGDMLYSFQGGPNEHCWDILIGPDGTLCSAWISGLVRWFDLETGKAIPLPVLQHPGSVNDLILSEDGNRLVTCCHDGVTRMWDWRTGELLTSFDQGDRVYSVALTSEGNVVSGSGTSGLRVWNPRTGQPVGPRWPIGAVHSVRVVRSGTRELVLAGVKEGGVYGYDLRGYRDHAALTSDQCLALAEFFSGRRITSSDTVTRLTDEDWQDRWNNLDAQQLQFLKESHPVNRAAWHRWMSDYPEGKAIRDWHREQLRLIDPKVAEALDLVEERRAEAKVWADRQKAAEEALEAAHEAAQKAEWEAARMHYEEVRKLAGELTDPNHLIVLALISYKLRDTEAYFQTSDSYVKLIKDSKDPWQLRLASRLYFGLPSGPDAEVRQEVLAMARHSVELTDPEDGSYPLGALALGLAEYRTGDPAAAIKWLEIARKGPEFCGMPAHAYRALVAAQLGKPEDAAAQFKTAEEEFARLPALTSDNWIGVVLSEMALEEARTTIRRRTPDE